jgi:hypothetical protein
VRRAVEAASARQCRPQEDQEPRLPGVRLQVGVCFCCYCCCCGLLLVLLWLLGLFACGTTSRTMIARSVTSGGCLLLLLLLLQLVVVVVACWFVCLWDYIKNHDCKECTFRLVIVCLLLLLVGLFACGTTSRAMPA